MSLPSSPFRTSLGAALACLTVIALVAPAARAQDSTTTMIVQYIGTAKAKEQGKEVMLVAVKEYGASRQMVLAVPSVDAKKSEYNPKPQIADPLKGMKPDDYMQIEVKKAPNASQKASLVSVKAYNPKPGELEENVYIFMISARQQEGGKDFIGVVLMKLGETITAQVPTIKTESGNMVPDQKMIASFEAFKREQPVEVVFSTKGKNPVIQTIDPYAAPEPATFVKMTEVDLDGQKADAMELTVKGKPVTAILSGRVLGKKWTPEPKLETFAKKLKPDQQIEARLVKDGDKTWLRYFEAVKETKAGGDAKPAAKDAGEKKDEKKDDKKEPAKK